jgi:ubiquinone/menaquinone biosynthesis C-methylase UbiE
VKPGARSLTGMANASRSSLVVSLGRRFMRQFGRPHGPLGVLAGRMMVSRNAPANRLLASRLGLEAQSRALDVGCGPGLGVEAMAALAPRGLAVGVDVSPVMVRQARARLRDAIRTGRARIERGDATALPFEDGAFDRVASTNSLPFWCDTDAGLREVHRVLARGGRLGLLLRLRRAGADPLDRRAHGMSDERLAEVLGACERAGFASVRAERDEVAGEAVALVFAERR